MTDGVVGAAVGCESEAVAEGVDVVEGDDASSFARATALVWAVYRKRCFTNSSTAKEIVLIEQLS